MKEKLLKTDLQGMLAMFITSIILTMGGFSDWFLSIPLFFWAAKTIIITRNESNSST